MKKIPRLTDHEEYRQASDTLTDLQGKLAAINNEINLLLAGQGNQVATNRLNAEAEAILTGKPVPTASEHLYSRALHERHVIERAIEIQRAKVAEIRTRISRQICHELRPSYASVVADVVDAVKRLADAMEAEKQFRDQLHQHDISYAGQLPPVVMRGVGDPKDDNSRISRFLRDAAATYSIH